MVGTYDPVREPAVITLKRDKIQNWIDKGAVPTATVRSLLKKEGFFNKTANA
jgi:small subunit ribosomal protein S16